ncbi:MAG: type IV toxin-antitoxin system AbiEi family antitoxin [Candidatus Sabulitectum sp.]|nr:type IV toxin-antitoxin system AbiEi family antitoxin [Candidatus Sabulitectum sp.]
MKQIPVMSQWLDQLQTKGRYTFTVTQTESATGRSPIAVQAALRRLKKQKRIVSPRRGFFVLVPPEYRTVGSPPASWFIHDLMLFLEQPYYVSFLSAASIHGAAHQQPMVFQVVTNKPTREMHLDKVTIHFSMNSRVKQFPVVLKQTETGTMRVATPETTAFDLVRNPSEAGHLSNVVTVLNELAELINKNALAEIAPLVRIPDVQRLGYLLEVTGHAETASSLLLCLPKKLRPVPLLPGKATNALPDSRWRVVPNVKLEPDS